MLVQQIAVAMSINANTATTQRLTAHRPFVGYDRMTDETKLTPLGKKCFELIQQDREARFKVLYAKLVEELKARGITRPSDILKYTLGMFTDKRY